MNNGIINETFITLTMEEIDSLSENINDLFANEMGKNILEEGNLLESINSYLQQLQIFQDEVFRLREEFVRSQGMVLNKMAETFGDKTAGAANRQAAYQYFGNKQTQIFTKAKKLFSIGYVLVNRIREYITNQTITYHIAIERAKSKDSIIYSATEEHIVKNLQLDTYRFMQALITEQASELDFSARYTATIKKSKIAGETKQLSDEKGPLALAKQGSTLWSKGYQVFLAVKDNPEIATKVNFGHFLETYYYFGGNKMNRKIRKFDAISFYQHMVALQNSTEFYKSGDFQDIQLKSNTATITNIGTIKSILIEIRDILVNYKGNKKNEIKKLLTTKKETKNQMKAKASKVKVTDELRKILAPISQ